MSKNNRHHFLVIFITGSLGLLIVLSLIPTGARTNLLGNLGSPIASSLYAIFGIWAWVFPLILFRLTAARFRNENSSNLGLRILGVCLGLVSLCAITRVLFHGMQMFPQSQMQEGFEWAGKLGIWVGDYLESALTRFGTVVVGIMALVLSLWFLGKENHLVDYSKRTVDGTAKGLQWFKDNGFEAFVEIQEKAARAFSQWKAKRQEKKIADEARRKLEASQKPIADRTAQPASAPIPSAAAVFPKQAKPAKPVSRSRAPFTGEASTEEPMASRGENNQPSGEGEDMVAMALAEAKSARPHDSPAKNGSGQH